MVSVHTARVRPIFHARDLGFLGHFQQKKQKNKKTIPHGQTGLLD